MLKVDKRKAELKINYILCNYKISVHTTIARKQKKKKEKRW